MKPRTQNILFGLAILIALIGIFRLKQVSKKNVEKIIEETRSAQAVVPAKIDPLAEILNAGLPAKCQFAKDLINSKFSGDIYVDGNSIRSDVTAPDKDGVEKLSHTIMKDNVMYFWYDKAQTGMKLVGKGEEDTQESTSAQVLRIQNQLGLEEDMNYKCYEWSADSFIFVPPLDVSFVDANEFMVELERRMCLKCEDEDSEASRLLCRKQLECTR